MYWIHKEFRLSAVNEFMFFFSLRSFWIYGLTIFRKCICLSLSVTQNLWTHYLKNYEYYLIKFYIQFNYETSLCWLVLLYLTKQVTLLCRICNHCRNSFISSSSTRIFRHGMWDFGKSSNNWRYYIAIFTIYSLSSCTVLFNTRNFTKLYFLLAST